MKALDFDDVLIVPRSSDEYITSRKEVNLECNYTFCVQGDIIRDIKWSGIPVIASNMDHVGTFEVAEILSKHKMLTCLNKKYKLSDYKNNEHNINFNYVIPSTGIKKEELDKCINIANEYPTISFVCLDIANGYLNSTIEAVKYLRKRLPFTAIIAGNVVTEEGCDKLYEAGANIIKVGIGSGSVCTTRTLTGIGYPQFSALLNCNNYEIVSDGGCKNSGDIMKAFAGGADFVMIGGMLAGHVETGSEFYGMSSREAMVDKGLFDNYKASEGKCVTIESRGSLESTILEILGGMRSSCTYLGTKQLSKVIHDNNGKNLFVEVNRQKNEVFDEK